ncbi:LuxR family transcriptional regulator [Streptomyces achromogenes]|uniref:LuxR family transcriptional regulator n=1 Tax=Streptomyces achromogenes TaxID=67255 RepID=A0ABZ1KY07_STRAH
MSAHIGPDVTGPDRIGPGNAGPEGAGLIGRDRERERVAALLAALPRDGGQVLHLSGAPGTGRTAVLRHAAARAAEQGVRVLSTAWAPAEREWPLAALNHLLRPALHRATGIPDRERAVLDTAFGGGPATPAPAELAAAVLRLLDTLPGPVLLCVDDLDRLDPASRDTLRAVAGLCGGTRVGLIVTERTVSGAPPCPHPQTVTLGRLPDLQARALVALAGRVTGYAEEQLVLAVARGNPLALTELSLGDGPLGDTACFGMLPATPRLAEAYAEDRQALSALARTVLLTAALSASPVTRDILAASALLLDSADAARDGLAEVVARGLVVESPGPTDADENAGAMEAVGTLRTGVVEADGAAGAVEVADTGTTGAVDAEVAADHLRFPDPLVRPAVLGLESTPRRMAAHAALGQSIGSPAHAAWHAARCAAGPDEELARRLESLAAGPRPGGAVLVALAALEGAARLSPDPERGAARLLRAAELAGERGLADQALRYVRQIDPTGLGTLGRALLLRVYDLLPGSGTGGRERIAELCEAAREVAAQDPALARKLLLAAARRGRWQQCGPDERHLLLRTAGELRAGPRDAWYLTVTALTDPLRVPGPADPRPAPGVSGADHRSLLSQAATLTLDFERAAPLLEETEAALRAEGRYRQLPLILVPRAMCRIWLGGEWHTALALAEEARTIADRTGQPDWAARATGMLGIVEALRGEHDRSLEYAAEVEESSLRLGQNRQLSLAVLARALTASGTGRYAEAYDRLRSLFTDPATPYAFEQFWGLAFLAEAAPPAGEQADARSVVDHVASLTGEECAPLLRRILAYADAVLAPEGEAEARYRRALRPGIEVWPLLHGMTAFGYGAWLRRRRRVTDSRTPLATAESVFRTLGASSRAAQTASELRATGWAAEGDSAGTPAGDASGSDLTRVLSPQQLTIARLAARGLTNRAIGEQLRLSPRTVASHLYQIFPKLGVSSRAQLAALMGTG